MRFIVTGGAGFIGANTVARLLGEGHDVVIVDNLSRRGSEKNLAWLEDRYPYGLRFEQVDVRDFDRLKQAIARHGAPDVVLHLAAQVAVTTSVLDPRQDFEINALGTLNLLEAIRTLALDPVILYTSTNKVYGALEQFGVVETPERYQYRELPRGVSEEAPLDFYSPYGCSKGTADQYVRDYHRIYGLRTIVFRNSCIYGPRQFGIEDQGWLAWFVIAAVLGRPITIYGDGKQVRDVLYVDDLVDAMLTAINRSEATRGQVYNVGGGPENTLAVWRDFGPMLERSIGRPIQVKYDSWRPGDQRVYISDIGKAARDFDWRPQVTPGEGIQRLVEWVLGNRSLFEVA